MARIVLSRLFCVFVICILGSSSMMGVVALRFLDENSSAETSADDAPSAQAGSSANANPTSSYPWLDDDGDLLDFKSMLESYRKNAGSISYHRTSRYSDTGAGLIVSYATYGTTLTVRATVSDYGIANYEFEEGSFQALVIPEMQLSTNYGMPALPYEKILFGIPSGVEVISVRAYSRSSESLLGLNVVPGPKPVAIYGNEVPNATLYFNPDAYSSTNMLPSQLVESETVQQGSERALMITLHPLQYNPSLKQGLLHEEISIDVRFSSPITYEGVTFNGWSDYQGANYTIITTSEFLPVLSDFINWKTTLGFTVQYETISDILSSYAGRDNPEKVRSFISAAFYENHTEYFLLVGDCDIVPVREVVDPAAGPGLDNGTEPSDLYYECLDGSWDANGNDAFGEMTDEVDLFPEVKVGRLPVQTPLEAQAVLMRIISYESDPEPGDWLNEFMLIAVDCFGSGDGVVMSEGEINQKYLFDSFFDVFRYYPTDLSLSTPDIVAKMNSGINIVNFFDHGAYDVWYQALAVSDVLGLTNGNKSFFAFAMACETAAFDVESVEPTIGEAFFRNLGGGSSTYVGATRVAWAGYDCFDGYHNAFWDYFLTEALSSHEARPKEAFHAAINYMATTFDTTNAPTLESIYQAIYFGDPSLTLYWKHNVTTITAPVEVNENVILNGTCFTYNDSPIIDTVDITVTDPLGTVVYSNTVATDVEGRYSVEFIASPYPGDYSVQTHIAQPFEYTAVTSFAVGTLDMTLQLEGVPVYNTYLDFSGTIDDDCDGSAILLDSTGVIIANFSLTPAGGIFVESVNTTGFGWLRLYVQFGNGTATGGAEIEFKVIRGEILIIADNAGTTSGPEYPGGWADNNFGDGSNPGDYVLALQNEYEVSVFFTMHNSTPTIELLDSYDAVIVSTGDNYGYPLNAPASYLLDVLYAYHIGGGPLLFEGGSILYSLASSESARFSTLFHVEFVERATNLGALELVKGTHVLMSGLPTSIPLAAGLGSAYADVFTPANGSYHAAEYGGDYIGGTAISALAPSAELGSVVFIGFSIDAIVDQSYRDTLIQNALAFLLHPSLMVTISDDALQTGTSETLTFEVTDSATGAPVGSASVSLAGCGVSASNTTMSDGTCSIYIAPTTEGVILANVTKGGYLNFTADIIVYNTPIVALSASPSFMNRGEAQVVTFTATDYFERFPLELCFVNATGLGNSATGYTNVSGMVDLILTAATGGQIVVTGSMAGYNGTTLIVPVRVTAVVLPSVGTYYSDECCWNELMLHWENYGSIPVSIDYTTFQTESITLGKLEEINADVVIGSFQLGTLGSAEIGAVQDYIRQGHGFTASGGGLYYNPAEWGPFLGLSDSLALTNTQILPLDLNLLSGSHPLLSGITDPYTNALGLTVYPAATGWDTSVLAGASYLALDSVSPHYAALLTFRGLVHFSFVPEYTSNDEDCQLVYNSILWSDYVTPAHDLAVSLDAPSRANPNEEISLTADVHNLGASDESDVVLRLYIDNVELDSVSIPLLENGTSAGFEFNWTFTTEGVHNVTAYVVPITGEYTYDNNVAQKLVNIVYLRDYYMIEGLYNWYDAVTNGFNLGMIGDDVTAGIALPFAFQYYDALFDTVYVSSNGWLSFANSYPYDYAEVEFPSANPDYAYAMAVFWNDLYATGNVFAWITEDRVVIEYSNYSYLSAEMLGTFEVVLYSSGIIEFNYQYMVNAYPGSVGLNYGDGIHYNSYGAADLQGITEFRLQFTWEIPEHDVSCSLIAPEEMSAGISTWLSATAQNTGNSTEYDVHVTLYVDSILVAEDTIASLDSYDTYSISYYWTPEDVGLFNVTAAVDPVSDEYILSNNVRTRLVLVEEQVEFLIVSPSHGETVSGGIVLIEYQTDHPENIDLIQTTINDDVTVDAYYSGNYSEIQEFMIPVFQNGTNAIDVVVHWFDGSTSGASFSIESVDVTPIIEPLPGDFYSWYEFSEAYEVYMNYTFGEMLSQFVVQIDGVFTIYYEGELMGNFTTELHVNILNGYIAYEPMIGMQGMHLFFLSGLRSPSTTGTHSEVGDIFPLSYWGDLCYVNRSSLWNGFAVWEADSLTAVLQASVFRYNGILAAYDYGGSDSSGRVIDTSFFPPPDTSAPVWLTPLQNITAEAGTFFTHQIEVYDDSGIDSLTVNGSLFSLNLSGLLTNAVRLHVGTYNLVIVATDPFGHELTGYLSIFVEDTTPPEWINPPGNLTIDFGEVLVVPVDAQDFSGIDHWSVNSTRFTVTAQGILTSVVQLQPGIYWLNISVYDIYDNMNFMILSVTVVSSGQPLDMFLVVWVGSMTAIAVGGFVAAMMRRRTRRGV